MKRSSALPPNFSELKTAWPYSTWSYVVPNKALKEPIAIHVCWRPDDPFPLRPPNWITVLIPDLVESTVRIFLEEAEGHVFPALYLMSINIELRSQDELWGIYANVCDEEGLFWTIHFDNELSPKELAISCYGGNHAGDKKDLAMLPPGHSMHRSPLVDDWQ